MTAPSVPETRPLVELLTIGREILDGRVIDTNSVFMAEALKGRGLIPRRAQRVDDERERILESFELAGSRSDIILVTGGLGPTSDDLTAEVFAHFLGEPWELRSSALDDVREKIERMGRTLNEAQKKQAYLAPSCFLIPNPFGTAPGFGFERRVSGRAHPQQWFFMPGVPREMKPMLLEQVMPRLPVIKSYQTRTWATHFTGEADLQEKLRSLETQLPPTFEITYRTRFPENHIGLHGDCPSLETQRVFDSLSNDISERLGSSSFAEADGAALPSLEEVIVHQLRQTKSRLALIESCTGGLISDRITDVPGASEVLSFSETVYSNAAKVQLGVSSELIEQHGAVSPETAQALAAAGLAKLQEVEPQTKQIFCLVTTGIAGPGGGSPTKPVGLCHIALARPGCPVLHEEIRARVTLERPLIKKFFSQKALDLLRRSL